MSTRKYDYGVFIGRLQIPHHGHFRTIMRALEQCETVILCFGSANLRRSLKNPFTVEQRASFIENCGVPEITKAFLQGRIQYVGIEDSWYSDAWWVEHVQRQVKSAIYRSNGVPYANANIALVSPRKDHTSYYLDLFPQWEPIHVTIEKEYAATQCRDAYYEFGPHDKRVENLLYDYTTTGVITALQFVPSAVHKELQARWQFRKDYKEQWGEGPFYTADALVEKSGNILLIKRGGMPDIGSWAMPGGFLNDGESPLEAAVRECEEETGFKIPSYVYLYHEKYKLFEGNERDERGDIRSHVYYFKLPDGGPLPEVKGGDDAQWAEWVPIVDLRADNMFADHYFICRKMLAGL